jgi:mRNA interferase MazF
LVAPLTAWKPRYEDRLVHVQVEPSHANGLTKTSAVDVLQLRGLSVARFRRKLGVLSVANMEEIVATVAVVIEYR